jgi:hypothetical protein
MKWLVAFVVLGTSVVAQDAPGDTYTIAAGSNTITITGAKRGAEGYYKEVVMNSTMPLRVFFKKNDKTDSDLYANEVKIYYKRNERGEEVCDVGIDGKFYWSSRVVYFVTANVQADFIKVNDNRVTLDKIYYLDQGGIPFSISRIAAR